MKAIGSILKLALMLFAAWHLFRFAFAVGMAILPVVGMLGLIGLFGGFGKGGGQTTWNRKSF